LPDFWDSFSLLVEIPILDHLIVAGGETLSFVEMRLLRAPTANSRSH
jgi:hypothetical protein